MSERNRYTAQEMRDAAFDARPETTTPASVAVRLTDEEIERLAKKCEYESIEWKAKDRDEIGWNYENIAAVMRDYVRLRKLNGKLVECLSQAYGDKMGTYRMIGIEVQNWGVVLAEAEEGEAK